MRIRLNSVSKKIEPRQVFIVISGIHRSRHSHMRGLRIQHKGKPYRVLYAFDPRRMAILLIGGNKTGDDLWYKKYVPIADDLYDEPLQILKNEELIND